MYSFMAGLVLLAIAMCAWVVVKDLFHPSFVFPGVWGLGLCAVAGTPLLGFYELTSESLFLFVVCGAVFSFAALYLNNLLKAVPSVNEGFFYRNLNYKKIAVFFMLMHLLILPIAYQDLSALGNGFEQISYAARSMAVSGEDVFDKVTANYLLVGLIVIPLLTFAVAKKEISVISYVIIVVPWCVFILIGTGRSGLIQMLLCLLLVYRVANNKLPVKILFLSGVLFVLVLVVGAIATNKVDLSTDSSVTDLFVVLLKHLAGYALQGPILFSLYFDNVIEVFPNWSPFASICHMLSGFGLCVPLPIHAQFNLYGPGLDGNVYSIYFSLYPNFGVLGTVVFMAFYSLVSTYAYVRARAGNVFFLVVAAYLYSASVLSLFADSFLPSLWFFIKVFCIVAVLLLFFSIRIKAEVADTVEEGLDER